jgi:hypothetical protein
VTRAVILAALAVVCWLVPAGPASAARSHTYAFNVTDARLSEVITFQGDGGPACQRAGVCGYSGTVDYSFQHADGIAAVLVRPQRVSGFGALSFGGLTTATVQTPGAAAPCTDKILRRSDQFEVQGTPRRVQVLFHAPIDAPNFLNTFCAGPRDADVAAELPPITLTARTLRHRSLLLQTAGTSQFHAGPFVGTVTFSAAVRLRRAKSLSDLLQVLVISS